MINQNVFLNSLTLDFRDDISSLLNLLSSLNLKEELSNNSYGVAQIVATELGLQKESIAVALLVSFVSQNSIDTQKLGKWDSSLLKDCINVSSLKKSDIRYQSDSFIQMVMALSPDPRVILILLAQKLFELRNSDSKNSSVDLDEIHYIYAPIAHRLGLYAIKTELEERWMRLAHYNIYRDIADKLDAKKSARDQFIKEFIAPIKERAKTTYIDCEIKGRPKSIFSIWKKMEAQSVDVDGVYDKFAIRIIIETEKLENEKELCWQVYSLVTEDYKPYPKRLRDWISHPKDSGYESLHTTVETENGEWVEVQIRTRRMDDIAEGGAAAHWKYKEGSSGSKSSWLSDMREALEKHLSSNSSHSLAKKELYSRDIFIFTPTDEIKRVRRGATVLDFAFSVHERVGLTCSGGVVNGEHSPIKRELKNGDRVEIITSKKQVPTLEWLSLVKSPSYKQKIRRALKDIEFKNAKEGRELLKRRMESYKIEFSATNLDIISNFFGKKNQTELFEAVGHLTVDILKIKQIFKEDATPKKEESLPLLEKKVHSSKQKRNPNALIIGGGDVQVDTSFASCCSPVPGDEIFGFISVNKGVRVHKMSCSNREDLLKNHPNRVIETIWNSSLERDRFNSTLLLVITDTHKTLSMITAVVQSATGVTLLNLSLKPLSQSFELILELEVVSRDLLETVKKKLDELSGVISVH
jgi:guanosine-3',5'-bis(diphosphate) 3'-pyrophosphohydrolase